MERNNFLYNPPIGTICTYDPGLDDNNHIFGKYIVEIVKYITGMPVCKILEVIELAWPGIVGHEIGKEVFFIVTTKDPNDFLKEII